MATQFQANVKASEVDKFNQLSDYWWDLDGPLKTLHMIQPVRMEFIRTHANLYHKMMLDVGCGGGILTEYLAKFSDNVIGIDKAENVLETARNHAQCLSSPPQYLNQSAEVLAHEKPQSFEIITCLELIEHVPDPESLMQALSTLLVKGGDLFISTINRTPKAFFMAIVGAEYVLKMLPKGTHQYETFLKPSELAQLARSFRLQCKALKGISYNIFTKAFQLSSDCTVNYIMHLQKEI